MARKHVSIISADGTFQEYTTHREAFSKVQEDLAEWIGTDYKTIRLFDKRVTPAGMSDFFGMHYRIKESGFGGPLVVQFTG